MRIFQSKHQSRLLTALVLLAACLPMMSLPQQAHAQAGDESDEPMEEIIITGSRRRAASPSDVPSPVTVINSDALQNSAVTDMSDIIRKLVPSFNVSAHPISGTASLVRPPNMRGLGADHTLVLVNGKRHHRAANIPNFSGGINDGTQGADISTIPVIALKSVEVLRDGAAAQYGADAIAGIMNFVANDDPDARRVEARYGEHYEGDGTSVTIAGIFGFALGDSGSLNISAEYTDTDRTERAQQSDGTQAFVDAGYTDIRDPAIWWGAPEVKDDIKLFVNLVAPFGSSSEFYGFATYNERENTSGFFFRNPARGGVFAIGSERIVFDTTSDGSGNCPALTVPDLSDSAAVAADLAAIEALRGNPDCFSFLEDFPGGTAPWFTGTNEDYMVSVGIRGEFRNELSYDLSYTTGENEVTYETFDTFNPTFGPQSPNFLLAGTRVQQEQTLNGQITYPFDTGFASPLNVAVGLEWREEDYAQKPGQTEAWDVGPFTTTAQGTTGISVGTLGFGSFSPTNSFSRSRNNVAVYIDAETDITDNWTLGAAVRYEDFDDLGDDTNFKVATLINITDSFGVRATYSTGFHAPTPGQQTFSQSTVGFNALGVLTTTSTLPADIAAELPTFAGIAAPLTPEESENLSFGILWDTDYFSLTVDLYRIDLEDRITLTSTAAITDEDRDALFEQGFTNANQFVGVNFFTNDFDTRTEGVDIIASIPVALSDSSSGELTLSFNHTTTEVTRQGPNLSDLRLAQLEDQLPNTRGNLAWTHFQGKFSGIARLNYYGSLTEYYLSLTRVTELDSQVTFDVEARYDVTDSLQIGVGVENLFDTFPTKAVYGPSFGSTYPVSSPAGFGGGFYYAKANYNFGG